MEDERALRFAYDWPPLPLFPLLCNSCRRLVSQRQAREHMDRYHPAWLAEWNAALKEAGIDG